MKYVVVTGGCGFIGTNLCLRLLRDNCTVISIDNLSRSGITNNLKLLQSYDKFTNYRIDIADKEALYEILHNFIGADIVHLAAQVAVTVSITDPSLDLRTNVIGTFNILEWIRSYSKDSMLINISTNKVYGKLLEVPTVITAGGYKFNGHAENGISEAFPLKFDSPYGCSKGAADQYAMDYAVTYGLKTVTLRQSCIYGDFQYGVEDQGWVAWFAIQALLGRGLTIYGNGLQVRDLLYVGDLVELYVKLIESKDKISGQVYNIGGGLERTLSLNALILLLNARLQTNMDVAYSSPRRGDQNVYISDIGKIGEEFDWHPSTSVEKGVDLLLNWLTDNIDLVRLALSFSSDK